MSTPLFRSALTRRCALTALLGCAVAAWAIVACRTPASAPQQPPVAVAAPAPARDVRFVVLHTNDVHGQVLTRKGTWIDKQNPPQVGGLARVAAYVNGVREETRASGAELLVVDAGDWYQGTPEGLVEGGVAFVRALTLVGYDAMCIGNHEFDHGIPNLLKLLREGGAPAVCANLNPKGSAERVDWVPAQRFVERGGIRIALVGLVTPITPEITHADAQTLDFVDPAVALARVQREVAGSADWILPVTHLGVDSDRALARAFPALPLIVGGHSHTLLKEGRREGDVLIVQAGTKASVVGRVDLVVHVPASDAADRALVFRDLRAQLVELATEPEARLRSAELDACCAKLAEHSAAKMSEVVGRLSANAGRSKDPLVSGAVGNLLADIVRERGLADVGLMNRGGIRVDLEAGPITRRMIFEIMPFDNTLVTVTVKGATLAELVRRAVEGTAHSGLEISGLHVRANVDATGKRTLAEILVQGAPLEPERAYRVALNSFMADGGDAYLDAGAILERKESGVLLREAFEDAFGAQPELTAPVENRYEARPH